MTQEQFRAVTTKPLTDAQRRTLIAVHEGKVSRLYRGTGNVVQVPAGFSPTIVWQLEEMGLVRDADDCYGTLYVWCQMCLTKAGLEALK